MSLFGRIVGAILGRNGFDEAKHEAEVQGLQEQAKACNDETQVHLGRMRDAFEGIDLDAAAKIEEPEDAEERVPPDR